jgi:hypothetical protein
MFHKNILHFNLSSTDVLFSYNLYADCQNLPAVDDNGARSATIRFVHLPVREELGSSKYSEVLC